MTGQCRPLAVESGIRTEVDTPQLKLTDLNPNTRPTCGYENHGSYVIRQSKHYAGCDGNLPN